MIKSRRMRWVRNVACMGKMSNGNKIVVGKLEGKRPLEDIGVEGKIILEWILGK
jgi:hypothetical protein